MAFTPLPPIPPQVNAYTYRATRDVNVVERVEDGALIPNDPRLRAWREYEAWLAAGNTLLPADPPPPEDAARRARRAALRTDNVITALANATPAQVDAYIDAQVTDLASARRVLKALAKAVSLLLKEGL